MRYVLKVAYDGTQYCGWQVQKNSITVQQVLTDAIKRAFGEDVCCVASGRTDSGVHALCQVCHVDLSKDIAGGKLADAINAHLPQDIGVLDSAQAPQGFDANRSAKKKTYRYSLYFAPRRNPLKERYSVWRKGKADLNALRHAASLFLGEHDFASYCAAGSQVKTTVRTIYSFDVCEEDGFVNFYVCGNGFLYNMVRTLVGTALDSAAGRLSDEDVLSTLSQGKRGLVGKTMPAKGLTLLNVDYGKELF